MTECIFCKIIAGESPSVKLYENKNVFVLAPLKDAILARGHMLVIPKVHYESIYDIDEKYLSEIMTTVKFISTKMKLKLGADGINILHASGKSGQQSVLHFHIHLIPRYTSDGLDTWPNTGYKEQEYPLCYEEIKNCLE